MNKLLLLLLSLLTISSCQEPLKNTSSNRFTNYKIIIIEDCEYIMYKSSNSYSHITHKGNCTNRIHVYK